MTILNVFLIGSGALMLMGASIGFLRFPDPLSRLHATGKVGGMATTCLLLSLFSLHASFGMGLKVLLIIVLLHFTAAQSAQSIARSTKRQQQPINLKSPEI